MNFRIFEKYIPKNSYEISTLTVGIIAFKNARFKRVSRGERTCTVPETAIITGWGVGDEFCDKDPRAVHHVRVVSTTSHTHSQASSGTLHNIYTTHYPYCVYMCCSTEV